MNEQYILIKWYFHWRFWELLDCVGGPIRFGWYADLVSSDLQHFTIQTADQVRVKREMGMIR